MMPHKSLVAVIFSKDRAMQLDACVRSLALYCKDIDQYPQRVIYTASSDRSEKQYEVLRQCHRGTEFVRETSFFSDLVEAIHGFSYVLFLVDDNLFVRDWSVTEVLTALEMNHQAIGFSLRLGMNTSVSYSLSKPQELPQFLTVAPQILKFPWANAKHDFGYPLEVSSSIYRAGQILTLIESAPAISNPNSLEAFLDSKKSNFLNSEGELLCFRTSVAFCNAVNNVQVDWVNRCGDRLQDSHYALMRKFDLGYRIDLIPLKNFITDSCHQEVELSFLAPPIEDATLSATIEVRSNQSAEALEAHKDISASSCLNLSDLDERDKDRVYDLLRLLRTEGSSSNWLLRVLSIFDELAGEDLLHAQSVTIGLKKNLAQMSKLRDEWYEPELSRLNKLIATVYEPEILRLKRKESELIKLQSQLMNLQSELINLQVEMRSIGHRVIRRIRHVLKNRMPLIFYLTRKLGELVLVLWGRYRKFSGKIQAMMERCQNLSERIMQARVVINRSWPVEQPLISVVIPNFNYGKYLDGAIDSVLTQTFQDFEIIIVDDASTDPDTRKILAAMNKPKTKVIFQNTNQGLPSTRNKGIGMARGKYICSLDPDDYLEPTYLEKCVYHLETRNLDVCFSWVQTFGESSDLWENGPFLIDVLMKGNSVCVAAVFKKALWKQVGGYKEAMTHSHEDWEFWLTLAEQGAVGHCIPEPLMFHRKHSTSMSAGMKHRYNEIAAQIKSLHPELYMSPPLAKKIRKLQKRTFIVINPFCNLLGCRNLDVPLPGHQIRILLATPWFELGGASIVKRNVFTHLDNNNVKVTAIAGNESAGPYTDNGLHFYKAITNECFSLARFLEERQKIGFLKYLIKSRHIELLYLAGSRPVYEMLPALKKAFPKLKVIDELYNTVGHVDSNREFSEYIDMNVAINEEVRNCLISLGESENRVQVITPGVDVDQFSRDNTSYRDAALKRPYKQFTFGFLGRLSPEKRPQDFVLLAGQLSSCHFRIAGDGPFTPLIADEIIKQGISDRCHMEGCTNKPVGFLAGIDALVITSEVEGLPVALLEAMAVELPIIATSVGGIPQVIMHGLNGFLYKPCQLNELCNLATMLSQMSVNDRQLIGRNARETVLKGHTISNCSANYLRLFKRIKDPGSN